MGTKCKKEGCTSLVGTGDFLFAGYCSAGCQHCAMQVAARRAFKEGVGAAAAGGIAGVEALMRRLPQHPLEDNEDNAGAIGEAFEAAVECGDVELCKWLHERYKHEDIYSRRLLEHFLHLVREHLWKRDAKSKEEMFRFLCSLPKQVNESIIGHAKMMHNGKQYLRVLEGLVREQQKKQRLEEQAAAAAGYAEEEEEEGKIESDPLLPDHRELLNAQDLIIWTDGEITDKSEAEATRKQNERLSEQLQAISRICNKIDNEFAKDEWDIFTSSEKWRGFFVKATEHADLPAGEALARHILKIQDNGRQLDVRFASMSDSRQTFFPQRYYYSGHVSKSKLAMVKRATNQIKSFAKKNSIWQVMFHTEDRAWFWPPIFLVGWSKSVPGYLVGARLITHDQEHLHHGQ